MPELPEVETVRRGLESAVLGRRALTVAVGRERVVRRTSAAALTAGLTGRSHFLIGSTAERVVRLSRIPVLTVRVDG